MAEDISQATKAKIITVDTKYGHLNFNMVDSDVDKMVQEGWLSADSAIKAGLLG